MTQKTIKLSLAEIQSKPLEKNSATNKTDVYHNEDLREFTCIDFKRLRC